MTLNLTLNLNFELDLILGTLFKGVNCETLSLDFELELIMGLETSNKNLF